MAGREGQQLGNYRLIRLLGQGGFADVYLGEHVYLRTQAALKVLRIRLTSDAMEDFLNEARTIARLEHPHIVRVLECAVEDQIPFLVMGYAPGGSLRLRYSKSSRVPIGEVISYVQQVAEALQYAHDRKLIHRDIKPENMLLGQSGEVLLSDFGLVLIAQSTGSQTTKEMAGTIPYMAPEQLEGRPRAASDQYALGIVTYEWLSGARPFKGSFTEIASQHLLTPPPPLYSRIPGISRAVEQVLFMALAKDPRQRFANVQAFARALAQASQIPEDAVPGSLLSSYVLDQSAQSTFVITPPSDSSQATVLKTHALGQSDQNPSTMLVTPHQSSQSSERVLPLNEAVPPTIVARPSRQRRTFRWSIILMLSLLVVIALMTYPALVFLHAPFIVAGAPATPGQTITVPVNRTPISSTILPIGATTTSVPKTTATPRSLSSLTPAPVPTATPAPVPTATPAPVPTPKPTPSPTPTPMLVVTPTIIGVPGDGTNCSGYVPPVTCTVTLSESSRSQSSLYWNTSNGGTDATFSPSSGRLSPGQTIDVTITTSSCGGSFYFYFEASWNTVTVTYNCG